MWPHYPQRFQQPPRVEGARLGCSLSLSSFSHTSTLSLSLSLLTHTHFLSLTHSSHTFSLTLSLPLHSTPFPSPSHTHTFSLFPGSGSGRDCYILSKLVGEEGSVVGVDMTENQLKTASEYVQYHTSLFGYSKPNVEFVHGYIEKLGLCHSLSLSLSQSLSLSVSLCLSLLIFIIS